jgi:hypothetical protein
MVVVYKLLKNKMQTYNPKNLIGKRLEISYHKDAHHGEYASLLDIGNNQYKISFEKYKEDDLEDSFLWEKQLPEKIEDDGRAYFRNIGEINFYLKIAKEEQETKEQNNNMQITIKELSDKLGVDVVYMNGFVQTLVKLGKATIVGKVNRPTGTRGVAPNIYEIDPDFYRKV